MLALAPEAPTHRWRQTEVRYSETKEQTRSQGLTQRALATVPQERLQRMLNPVCVPEAQPALTKLSQEDVERWANLSYIMRPFLKHTHTLYT